MERFHLRVLLFEISGEQEEGISVFSARKMFFTSVVVPLLVRGAMAMGMGMGCWMLGR